ncbi:Uma2 family endonuclease [Streptomyces sp. AV19]|uniref:Uma2 family endonuclease n=1 Tax=Streptomyces sp. AV19 TaxID=2793068 RepID=UPI0018FE436D|nr:Uma2 family endonuclease [Streptomyces sp. AV19]MBH1934025.1 Uma2 family endonuclease [Streptomyces sp. AV19]MDG4535492.1 Uma2 family endonuclease [Streptomyces sp. AV19]
MTVVLDRIEMADSDELSPEDTFLDDMFDRLERLPVPEGYKVEIVEGTVYMSPQRRTHWRIIFSVARQLDSHFGEAAEIDSDVRIDLPGYRNGFCPDVAKAVDGAKPDAKGRFDPKDLEFIAEVISKDTKGNDYGPKKQAYAEAGVPVLLIVDPYEAKCHVHTSPKDGAYHSELITDFGEPIDLTCTPLGLTISTDKFPRD